MAWLRLDDGFTDHVKFEGWTRTQRWALLELFMYCARHKTGGYIPADISLLPRCVTPALLQKALSSGFLDQDLDGHISVHDWHVYNPSDPTAAERMQRHRERNANRNKNRNGTVSSRARIPSPTPESSKELSRKTAKDELWEALVAEIGEPSTKSERGRFNAALKELREVGASPDDVRKRCKAYRREWPEIELTPQALVGNWTRFAGRGAPEKPGIEETLDLPELSDADRAQNLERIQALTQGLTKEPV